MRRFVLFALVAALVAVVAAPVQAKNDDQRNFTANLKGRNEVGPVDSQGTGVAKFQLSQDGSELHFKLNVSNTDDVTQAHIHIGAADANGPVAAFLYGFGPTVSPNGTLAEGTLTDGDVIGMTLAELVDELRAGNTYVNVHTVANPAGELRGQIG